MSTQTRSGGGGGRNQKKSGSGGGGAGGAENNSSVANKKATDVPKQEKEKISPKPTAEQIRIAQITDIKSGTDDPKLREKVATLMEMTQRSEEEVCCALYECDNDLNKAADYLLEQLPVGAFETSSKKKKNRVSSTTNEGSGDGEWNDSSTNNDTRERSRNRSGNRGGRGGSDSRGFFKGRGRESRENDRNASDSKGEHWRGRGRGSSRGGYGGRGGRGGRMGPRGMGSRDYGRNNYSRQQQDTQEVDTWDNTIATNADQNKQDDAWGDWDNEEYVGSLKDSKVFTPSNLQNQTITDTWGDWDNEEYVGSLKDSKVFTPSNLQNQTMPVNSDLPAPPGLEQQILNPPSQMTAEDLVQQYSTTVVSSTTTAAAVAAAVNPVQFPDIHSGSAPSVHLRTTIDMQQQMNPSSTLSAEQSQYFNSLPSQNTNAQTNVNSYQTGAVQYPTSYGTSTVYGDQVVASQPSVRRARAKVPPPSKIPSSAVEMPGDTLNNIGYLDVQFGGLDFGAEESFETLTEKFNSTSIDAAQQNAQTQDVSNDYQAKTNAQQAALTAGLQSAQITDNSLSTGYNQRNSAAVVQQQNANVSGSINSTAANALDQLSKNDPYNQSNSANTTGYQSSYSSTASSNKTPSYQATGSNQGYSSNNYANTQVSSGNSYQPSTNNYNSYNQSSVNSYQQQNNTSANSSSNAASANSVSSSATAANIGGGSSAVNNASSNTSAGYLSSQYQTNQTTSAFSSQPSAYQSSQSVYGNTGSLNNNAGFTGSTNTSSSQYSNFSSSKLKETTTPASTPFESVSSVSSSVSVSSTVSSVTSSTTTNSMSSPSLGLANTKVTNTTAKSAGGVVPNVQMVSQFIQTGVPYYQQPVYSYEDIQLMQQRVPVAQYYDINYPPTSLGAAGVRDANLGSVAYSTMTDGRFTRTDNNSSPVSNVSSTMSQQAGSGGPMLNVPYAYFYGGNMMPGGFQYSTPAIYSQQMATANATSGGQFPKPSYNSGYGTAGYDTLSQATQDYSKGAYPGTGVSQQSKGASVTNPPQAGTASDITSSMYGKSHVALNKVNSYDKQSFHSATPPPFNLTSTQTAGATSAQPYGMYIQPMPAAHHNMNIHQPIHQMDGRIHSSSRRDSNSAGQRQQTSSQSKTGAKQGYSPSYWTGQN